MPRDGSTNCPEGGGSPSLSVSHSLRVVLWDYSNLCTHRRAASAWLSCRKPWGGVALRTRRRRQSLSYVNVGKCA